MLKRILRLFKRPRVPERTPVQRMMDMATGYWYECEVKRTTEQSS